VAYVVLELVKLAALLRLGGLELGIRNGTRPDRPACHTMN
jgi:hypothetical protein